MPRHRLLQLQLLAAATAINLKWPLKVDGSPAGAQTGSPTAHAGAISLLTARAPWTRSAAARRPIVQRQVELLATPLSGPEKWSTTVRDRRRPTRPSIWLERTIEPEVDVAWRGAVGGDQADEARRASLAARNPPPRVGDRGGTRRRPGARPAAAVKATSSPWCGALAATFQTSVWSPGRSVGSMLCDGIRNGSATKILTTTMSAISAMPTTKSEGRRRLRAAAPDDEAPVESSAGASDVEPLSRGATLISAGCWSAGAPTGPPPRRAAG